MSNTFKKILEETPLVLVDFHAEWCGPCKAMKPILTELKTQLDSNTRILKVDIDKNQRLAQALNVQSVPTLMLYKNGSVVWRQSGVLQTNELKNIINQHK